MAGGPQQARLTAIDATQCRVEADLDGATGHSMKSARKLLDELCLERLDFLITDSGAEIYYGWPEPERDESWSRHIAHHWKPARIRDAVGTLEGIAGGLFVFNIFIPKAD